MMNINEAKESILVEQEKPVNNQIEQEKLYEGQDPSIVIMLGLHQQLFSWQRIMKSALAIIFFILLLWDLYFFHDLIHHLLTPGFVTVANAALFKIILISSLMSILGLISGLVAVIGRWSLKAAPIQE